MQEGTCAVRACPCHPQGLCVLPTEVPASLGTILVTPTSAKRLSTRLGPQAPHGAHHGARHQRQDRAPPESRQLHRGDFLDEPPSVPTEE